MDVRCPKCQTPQFYSPRKTQQRQRKTCTNPQCGFTFKANSIAARFPSNQGTTPAHMCDDLDQKIIVLIKQNQQQRDIAQKLQVDASTISRHLLNLVNCGVLTDLKSRPRYYKVNLTLPSPGTTPQKKAIFSHHIQVRCDILQGKINPAPEELVKKYKPNGTWEKTLFKHRGQEYEVNPHCVIFWVPKAAGYTTKEVDQNAFDKAVELRKWLQMNFNCQLGTPEFTDTTGNQKIHYNPLMPANEEQVKAMQDDVWNDATPPNNPVETNNKEKADEYNVLPQRIEKVEVKVGDLEKAIQSIAQSIKEMSQTVGQAVTNALREAFGSASGMPAGTKPPPGPQYI